MRRIVLLGVIAALALLFFNRLIFSELILARGDTYTYFYPYWSVRDALMAQGQIPLWTPDIFMGVPLLSNPQVGVFYPPNWITIFFNAPTSIATSIVIHTAWATLGAYLLARRATEVEPIPALIAAVLFGFGGYLGAHVEQINQLQGLSWMPWAFLVYVLAIDKTLAYAPLLAVVMALQLLSGHTQTVFVTGVGLAIYAFVNVIAEIRAIAWFATEDWRTTMFRRVGTSILVLLIAGGVALVLALPQLIPTMELAGLSNRGDGLNQLEAMAFSWNPILAARGLLPSYDAQVFSEYVAYIGVFGLGLALVGAASYETGKRRAIWLLIATAGIFLALGVFNPIYWTFAQLPGFNLFRVPARWLALFALAASMLAGMGANMLLARRRYPKEIQSLAIIFLFIAGLALTSIFADQASADIDGPTFPLPLTWGIWIVMFIIFANVVILREFIPRWATASVMLVTVVVELFLASQTLPYADLVDGMAFDDPRFTAYQMQVYEEDEGFDNGRLLSVSQGFFDTGDKAALQARFDALGMTERAQRYGFTDAKLKELLAPNLPMIWGISTIDGFGGGVLPTTYWTQFTSLMLPDDAGVRSADGRLRELLADEACFGVCLPESRWLNLTNTQYFITDKTFDLWHEGVAYDTAIPFVLDAGELAEIREVIPFQSTEIHVLYDGALPELLVDGEIVEAEGEPVALNRLTLAVYPLDEPTTPESVTVAALDDPVTVRAVSLVDVRTGAFVQLTLGMWRKLLSSDIKLYENLDVMPKAFMVSDILVLPDTWQGTEDALVFMDDPDFDPAQEAVILTDKQVDVPNFDNFDANPTIQITEYENTRIELEVTTESGGYLILTDAYYPGWRALVNWLPADVYRANVMFRAVRVPAGTSAIVFEYAPDWYPWIFIVGAVSWVLFGLLGFAASQRFHWFD